jgi:hypothetical protein
MMNFNRPKVFHQAARNMNFQGIGVLMLKIFELGE